MGAERKVPYVKLRQVALVTGASRGIGRATALALARAGYDVAFTARTAEEGQGVVPPRYSADRYSSGGGVDLAVPGSLRTTRERVEALGARALPLRMDLLDRGSVREAAAVLLREWGGVDLLVNNAVAHVAGNHDRLLDLDVDVAARTMEGNYLNQVVLLQALLPSMVERGGGTIVNMCSGSATTDPPAAAPTPSPGRASTPPPRTRPDGPSSGSPPPRRPTASSAASSGPPSSYATWD